MTLSWFWTRTLDSRLYDLFGLCLPLRFDVKTFFLSLPVLIHFIHAKFWKMFEILEHFAIVSAKLKCTISHWKHHCKIHSPLFVIGKTKNKYNQLQYIFINVILYVCKQVLHKNISKLHTVYRLMQWYIQTRLNILQKHSMVSCYDYNHRHNTQQLTR